MADEKPTLHIDTDWKRQAQEEKRRLAEQEKQRAAGASPAPSGPPPGAGAGAGAMPSGFGAAGATAVEDEMTSGRAGARPGAAGARGERGETPPATLAGLVSQLMTQTLFYLGELAPRGGEPMINLDMAKHNIDLLGVLEEKTRGNLTPEEKRLLDSVLYELRMRYVSVASQYIT